MELIFGAPGTHIALLALIMFAAGLARGYSGFGLSAVVITAGSIFIAPVQLAPVLYILEILASVHMIRGVYKDIDWSLLSNALIGCVLGMPVGQTLLLYLPDNSTRVALYSIVVLSTLALHKGYHVNFIVNRTFGILVGLIVGLGSGLAMIGGLVAMIVLLGVNYDVVKARANMVVVFFGLYIYGIVIGSFNGIVTPESFKLAAIYIVPVFGGLVLGEKGFVMTSKEQFLKILLVFLTLISFIGLVRISLSGAE